LASRKFEERIEQLRQLRRAGASERGLVILRPYFGDRSNLVIAEAAKTAAALRLVDCIPDLLAVYDRLFADPVKTDPKCLGKAAIVRALTQLDYSESAPFIRGVTHVQMEGARAGLEDSAAPLRAHSALALAQCSDLTRGEMLRYLVDALSDPEDPVRLEAVRALHQAGGDEAALLLRLKARTGDARPLIMGHVFDALLNLEQSRAVNLVAERLNSAGEDVREEAALALGASRLPAAVAVLIKEWHQLHGDDFRSTLLRAISSSRLPEAIAFLLRIVTTGSVRQSAAAIDALKIHQGSSEIQARVQEAMNARR